MRYINSWRYSKIYLLLIVVTSLFGGLIHLGMASLYHFVFFFISFMVIIASEMKLKISRNNPILRYMFLMLFEATISVLWAPDKGLAGRYVYNIFLLFLFAFIFDSLLTKENIKYVVSLMVVVLFCLNLIGIWESITNNHLLPGYLDGAGRSRILAFVPGGFFMNPNDFATYIIQILPFSFIASIAERNKFRIVAITNIFLAAYVVLRTESRTQIIMMIVMLVLFIAIAIEKGRALKLIAVVVIGSIVVYNIYPAFMDSLTQGLASISRNEIIKSSEGGSLGVRIALLMNCGMILLDTLGFGIGAGCHRVVMNKYSSNYFYTSNVTVMHNLLGEIFADYGMIIGILFIVTIFRTIRILYRVSKVDSENEITAKVFIVSLCTFVICGIASSSIIQITSIWTTFFYIGAFVRTVTEDIEIERGS